MGSKAPTTTSTNSIPASVLQQYQSVINRANNVASSPYQAYTGQLVAGLNPTQQGAITALGGLADPTNMFTQSGYNNSTIGANTVANASPYFQSSGNTINNALPYFQQGATGLGNASGYFGQASNAVGGISPYLSQASSYASKAAAPLDPTQYLSPYNQNVIDTTLQNIQHNNRVQSNNLTGSAIQAGNAFGGDRAGVAQAELARNQDQATNQTIAGLENSNWSQALQSAQYQSQNTLGAAGIANNSGGLQAQGANILGGLGTGATSNALGYGQLGTGQINAGTALGNVGNNVVSQGQTQSGIGTQQSNIGNQYYTGLINQYNAALQGGNVAQNNNQAALNAAYQQYANQTAFPYQQTGWLSNISTGLGAPQGGTTTTQGSAPNVGSQIAGAATTAAALFSLKRGGVVPHRASGGVTVGAGFPMAGHSIDITGEPGGGGLIPYVKINQLQTAFPKAVDPNAGQKSPQQSAQDFSKGVGGISNGVGNAWDTFQAGQRVGQAIPDAVGPTSIGGSNGPMPLTGGQLPDLGGGFGLYARGGLVPRHYADGGMTFDDRMSPTIDAIADGTFDPRGPNSTTMAGGLVPMPRARPVEADRDAVINPNDPFPLNGSYHDNPANNYPVTQERAAANYRGDDAGPVDAPAVAAINAAAHTAPQVPDQALAYNSPNGGGGLAPATGIAPEAVRQANESAPVGGLAPRQDGAQAAGGLLGRMGVTEDGRQALLSLGLGLLANRSPNFGTALGEAGLGAVASMNEAQKQRQAQAEKDREFVLKQHQDQRAADEAKRAALNQPIIIGPDGKPTFNSVQLEYQRRLHDITDKDAFKTIKDINGVEHLVKTSGEKPVDVTPKFDNANLSGDGTALTGDEFLKTLPSEQAGLVKKLANYELDPRVLSTKGGHRERLLGWATQYDPGFSPSDYGTRYATRKDFTSGKSAQNISSFNTALGHLDKLDHAIDPLGNRGSSWWNAATAPLSMQTDPKYQKAIKEFQAARTAAADELTRAFRLSGGNVHDIKQWEGVINAADSPLALHAAVRTAVELLKSRIDSVGDQYNRGMSTNKQSIELLSPAAKKTVSRLMGDEESKAEASGSTETTSSSASPTPRLAPDGNYYVPDPARPGKYLRVVP